LSNIFIQNKSKQKKKNKNSILTCGIYTFNTKFFLFKMDAELFFVATVVLNYAFLMWYNYDLIETFFTIATECEGSKVPDFPYGSPERENLKMADYLK